MFVMTSDSEDHIYCQYHFSKLQQPNEGQTASSEASSLDYPHPSHPPPPPPALDYRGHAPAFPPYEGTEQPYPHTSPHRYLVFEGLETKNMCFQQMLIKVLDSSLAQSCLVRHTLRCPCISVLLCVRSETVITNCWEEWKRKVMVITVFYLSGPPI